MIRIEWREEAKTSGVGHVKSRKDANAGLVGKIAGCQPRNGSKSMNLGVCWAFLFLFDGTATGRDDMRPYIIPMEADFIVFPFPKPDGDGH